MFGRIISFSALTLRADGTYTPFSGDAWAYAGQMTLLGMLMVFAVLAILWGILAIFKLIFAGKSPKAEKKSVENTAPVETVTSDTAAEPQADDSELIAVITAAVAAYRQSEGADGASATGFRVVSFKRNGGRAWNSK